MKSEERKIARMLRRDEGLPLRVIAERLGVAKSSVSRWVRDIELTPEQHAALSRLNHRYNGQLLGQEERSASARAARLEAQEHGREYADAMTSSTFKAACSTGERERRVATALHS